MHEAEYRARAHHVLGLLAHHAKDFNLALIHLNQALLGEGDHAAVFNTLGSSLRELGRDAEARSAFERAIALDPSYAQAHYNLGVALVDARADDTAYVHFQRATELTPDFVEAMFNLGVLDKRAHRHQTALLHFSKVLKLQPKHESALHLYAAMTGETTNRAPKEFIVALFDRDAPQFDTHLVQELGYDTPTRLREMFDAIASPSQLSQKGRKGLDLGCGTGLSGLSFADTVEELTGVDLSRRMLAYARERDIYKELVCADIEQYLSDFLNESLDLLLAADVLIYFGSLEMIAAQAGKVLRRGGCFAFSVESIEQEEASKQTNAEPFELQANGRYRHSFHYLQIILENNNMRVEKARLMPTRMEAGIPVLAWLILAVKT